MEFMQFLIIILFSPLVNGTIKKFKAGMQGRVGPSIVQPYYDLLKLFKKDMVISNVTSWIFKVAPYVVFASSVTAVMLVPVVTAESSFFMMGDVIALIYILALGRFFMALAGLDAGTAFGGEGSSREMTVTILVEAMMMLSIFTAAISAGSTNIARIAASDYISYSPAHVLALAAFIVAIIAETGRIPVDNPDTHLELTMIHEGMILEYSGRYLAIIEWAQYIKQMLLFTIAIDVFLPFGISMSNQPLHIIISCGIYFVKILFITFLMAFAESTRAKLRFFQLPSLLGGAFVLALLSLLTYTIMGK
ncbi:MAG: NADH-quinone oxidoreductase subunit H [Nitrospiraceae bacterium]|nr:NADH-quinone oxidoreductase subunit H [Nitrospiraceae bacterium]